MDPAPLTAIIGFFTALIILLCAVIKLWMDLRQTTHSLDQTKGDYDRVWRGILRRGFTEAVQHSMLLPLDTPLLPWKVADKAKLVYVEIAPSLRTIRNYLRLQLLHEPNDEQLAWAIEQDFQVWMLTHACPLLGLHQHGCLALACVIAREEDTSTSTVLPVDVTVHTVAAPSSQNNNVPERDNT